MMEEKWMWIAVAVGFIMLGVHGVMDSYQKNQCRISYAASTKSPEEIAQLCK